MSDLFQPSLADMIAECERELKQREAVYPRLIAKGSLTRARSDRQIAVMRATVEYLKANK